MPSDDKIVIVQLHEDATFAVERILPSSCRNCQIMKSKWGFRRTITNLIRPKENEKTPISMAKLDVFEPVIGGCRKRNQSMFWELFLFFEGTTRLFCLVPNMYMFSEIFNMGRALHSIYCCFYFEISLGNGVHTRLTFIRLHICVFIHIRTKFHIYDFTYM